MTVETLVSCVKQNMEGIAQTMNLDTDAIVINQCDSNDYLEYEYKGNKIKCYSFREKGVGLSRNSALMRATADIVLFSDEDIRYVDGYGDIIRQAFESHPQADMLLFNFDVVSERATYHTDKETKISWLNCGRYPTYSFAIKREKLCKANITFNLLFGGGAKYCNGEDSLFIRDCVKNGFKIVALPITLGKEEPRPSTWFNGYNEKFFHDRGVLYKPLYGKLAKPLAIRFLLAHREEFFKDNQEVKSWKEAYALMKKGIKEY